MRHHTLGAPNGERIELSSALEDGKVLLASSGLEGEAKILVRSENELLLEVGGHQLRAAYHLTRETLELLVRGKRILFQRLAPDAPKEDEGAVGDIAAPMTGRVVSVECSAGDEVLAGATLVVLEAMKMEHRLAAPAPARVCEVLIEVGQQVDIAELLVTLEALTEDEEP